ncbi:patatin-like phospholipase family protein [Shimia aestuarii]|uniref:NTE family protein n=1 Tax=Shimia aestuarii TaxID=254406 RepID=A0A1I4P6N4_9RHOB|nr:patatin-like phospholipase family protein [Shimia aestuarii]SFM23379.1 NTE family protein [Shimia aestuarii]
MAEKKRINLALQGGGAHGAFTWGVLDVLLQDPGIEIAAISGTSAGAMNGAALKAGLLEGGPEAARANLEWLWGQLGAVTAPGAEAWLRAFGPGPGAVSRALEGSWPFMMADLTQRMMTPYVYGPFYAHPLRRVAEQFHYDRVCDLHGPQLFICATNVRSGKARVFSGEEISTDVLLASACLPTLFQAVEIDDPKTGRREAFWDGGYTGNPALWPFFRPELPEDVVIVNINPLQRAALPVTPQQIANRVNEISFNASLMSELRAIGFVQRLIAEGRLSRDEKRDVKVHMIADDGLMNDLSVATKTTPVPYVLAELKVAGQDAARAFLKAHRADLNLRGTVDLAGMVG